MEKNRKKKLLMALTCEKDVLNDSKVRFWDF